MTSGGHPHSGPAPDPQALRRDHPADQATWTNLPRSGCASAVPEWPLGRPTKREAERWAHEWTKPQSVIWERTGQADQVAQYVRHFVEAERPRAATSIRVLVKQEEEILGLSLAGLLRNRWRIVDAEAAVEKVAQPAIASARTRLRVVGE